jgi:hypothetical protein
MQLPITKLQVNDLVLIVSRKTSKPMQGECGIDVVFRVAGVLQQGESTIYWLWLEADDEYDGYDGTCVVQQTNVGECVILLRDERSSIPLDFILTKIGVL